jgi:diacylglycerol O-acyltransferase/trehalose O-mycolyltransferase
MVGSRIMRSSLTALLAATASAGGSAASPTPAAAAGSTALPSPECTPRTTAVPDGPARLVQDKTVSGYSGRLHDLTLYAPALSGYVHVDVLLPRGYSARPDSRYHALYLLHGSGGSYTDWVGHGASQILATGYSAANLPPAIVVMPDGGLEGYYTDWYGRDVDQPNEGPPPGWATFDLDELIPYIDSHYRTIASRSGRAIAGLSMGGFGATSLPARRPDMFAAAGSFSGADDIDYDYPYENALLYGTNPAFTGGAPDLCIWGDALTERVHWEAVDPTYLAGNIAPVDLFLASGDGTPGPYDSVAPGTLADTLGAAATEADIWSMNQGFVAALDQAGVSHTDYFYGSGTHSWPYWERDLAHFLPFLARAWAHPKPAPRTFDYRSESSSFSLWGWSFRTAGGVAEFTYLAGVGRGGLTVSGSGTLRVITAPLYPPGSRWIITAARNRRVLKASRTGRLSFPIELGPANAAQQTSFPSDGAAPSGWTTVNARIIRWVRRPR